MFKGVSKGVCLGVGVSVYWGLVRSVPWTSNYCCRGGRGFAASTFQWILRLNCARAWAEAVCAREGGKQPNQFCVILVKQAADALMPLLMLFSFRMAKNSLIFRKTTSFDNKNHIIKESIELRIILFFGPFKFSNLLLKIVKFFFSFFSSWISAREYNKRPQFVLTEKLVDSRRVFAGDKRVLPRPLTLSLSLSLCRIMHPPRRATMKKLILRGVRRIKKTPFGERERQKTVRPLAVKFLIIFSLSRDYKTQNSMKRERE